MDVWRIPGSFKIISNAFEEVSGGTSRSEERFKWASMDARKYQGCIIRCQGVLGVSRDIS